MLLILFDLLELDHIVAAIYQGQPLVMVLRQVAAADIQRCHEALAPSAALNLVGVNIVAVLKRALSLDVPPSLGLGTHRITPTAALSHDH
jgi:hypothetical protein